MVVVAVVVVLDGGCGIIEKAIMGC